MKLSTLGIQVDRKDPKSLAKARADIGNILEQMSMVAQATKGNGFRTPPKESSTGKVRGRRKTSWMSSIANQLIDGSLGAQS